MCVYRTENVRASFLNTPRIIGQFLQKDHFRKKDDEFPQKYDCYDSFPQNDPLYERWGAGVEYHFQEFNEPCAPS